MNISRNTTIARFIWAILFSFLTVVGLGSVTAGDLLNAPNRVVRTAEQLALRERVLGNIAASQRARAASRFDTWASTFDPSRMPRNAASTAFEARLPSSMYPGVPARLHFREANTQLLRAMDGDAQFAQMMDNIIPGIRGQLQNPRSVSTRPPRGWTWHHSVEDGVLHLAPSKQHWDPVLWRILHPNNQGGMSLWGGGY